MVQILISFFHIVNGFQIKGNYEVTQLNEKDTENSALHHDSKTFSKDDSTHHSTGIDLTNIKTNKVPIQKMANRNTMGTKFLKTTTLQNPLIKYNKKYFKDEGKGKTCIIPPGDTCHEYTLSDLGLCADKCREEIISNSLPQVCCEYDKDNQKCKSCRTATKIGDTSANIYAIKMKTNDSKSWWIDGWRCEFLEDAGSTVFKVKTLPNLFDDEVCLDFCLKFVELSEYDLTLPVCCQKDLALSDEKSTCKAGNGTLMLNGNNDFRAIIAIDTKWNINFKCAEGSGTTKTWYSTEGREKCAKDCREEAASSGCCELKKEMVNGQMEKICTFTQDMHVVEDHSGSTEYYAMEVAPSSSPQYPTTASSIS